MEDRLCNKHSGCADEIDDVGDLSQWNHLTETFDLVDIFHERTYEIKSSKGHVDDKMGTDPSVLMADPKLAASLVVDLHPQSSTVSSSATITAQQLNTSFQPQCIRLCGPPGCEECVTLALEPTPLSSMALSASTSKPVPSFQSVVITNFDTTGDCPTTPLNFNLEPFPCVGISSAPPQLSANSFTTNNNLAHDALVYDLDGFQKSERVCGGGMVRASSYAMGSASASFPISEPVHQRFQSNHVSSSTVANATMPSSFSCPTLPSAGNEKRSCPESFASGRRNTTSNCQIHYSSHEDNSWLFASSNRSIKVPSSSSDTATGNRKPVQFCKPLRVYNFFYRDERDNIVNGMKQHGDPLPLPVNDFSQAKFEQLLHHRWFVDPTKKRRVHRKQHGKIDFSTLSKVISGRWRKLPQHGRDFYHRVARADKEHYDRLISSRPDDNDDNDNDDDNDDDDSIDIPVHCANVESSGRL